MWLVGKISDRLHLSELPVSRFVCSSQGLKDSIAGVQDVWRCLSGRNFEPSSRSSLNVLVMIVAWLEFEASNDYKV